MFIQDLIEESLDEATRVVAWPKEFVNKDTGKVYKPHHQAEHDWVYEDKPRYCLIRGGEGSGKSVALVIKILNRLRRGMSGIMVSPNLPHFKRSLFPEFLRWLPRKVVINEHQRYFHPAWQPHTSFVIVVHNELGGYSTLYCAGGDNPLMLEGPNLSFAALDEIRGMNNDEILKVLAGRIRIPGPKGEPPQLFCSSTPRMHWMFDYFGPEKAEHEFDQYRAFKREARVVKLLTSDNVKAGNLDEGYLEGRGMALTEKQKEVRLAGEWGEEDNEQAFIEDITLWDRLKRDYLPPIRRKADREKSKFDVLVCAADGAVTRDHFAFVAVSRDPRNPTNVALRHVRTWKPQGSKIDFGAVKEYIIDFCRTYDVVTIVYDIYQLHDMMQSLNRDRIAWCQEFGQAKSRTLADQALYDAILQGQIIHDGNAIMREHLVNADAKTDYELNKRRLVKRADSLKIDAAVALSMANFECKRLNMA